MSDAAQTTTSQSTQSSPAPETAPSAAPPAFDPDALKSAMRETIREVLPEVVKPQTPEPPKLPNPNLPNDPILDVLKPYVAPAIGAVAIQAQAAMDAATFYTGNPEAIEMKDEIEKKFNELYQRGLPTPREDIYYWLRGRNFTTLMDKEMKRRAQKVEEAERAATAGPGSARSAQPAKPAYEMAPEELESALKGVSF